MFLQSATPVKAWGLATHMFIVSEVMEHISNDSWAEAFDYYSPEVLSGSTTPDQAWQDGRSEDTVSRIIACQTRFNTRDNDTPNQ